MKKLTKAEFLYALDKAVHHARLNSEQMMPGWRIREGIDMAKLPLPPFKELKNADEELRENPIFQAVKEGMNAPNIQPRVAYSQPSPYWFMSLAEAAWEHYKKLLRAQQKDKFSIFEEKMDTLLEII